ncbi:glycosyltransferase family 9 protein [Mucilaginibacter corticis]|uniref:Glycosyltransferase family 9 protein n=1 Tax=Mucilaginibacter corticis TaxID=2597670 RepID=A0A556M7V1_9SPHI|nr:glycosyltransferase family 9 protein [Mucilaginibacter corticis]TSJ35964.1 glycosyltransferase family 9 protein [Mucilaginibacter corticis]
MKSLTGKIKFVLIRVLAPAIIKTVFFFVPRKEKTVLIVRSDGAGDYILFRNYLYFLRNSAKYKDHRIYILENSVCKELATYWDAEIVDGFIWYTDGNFLKWELVKLLYDLQKLRIETIVYTNYSRKFTVDWIIGKVNAKYKIAVDGDCINASPELKSRGEKYYTELLKVNDQPLHEFVRNKQIFETMTGERCDLKKPFIVGHQLRLRPNGSIVIFAGAGQTHKRWNPVRFNRLCLRIAERLKIKIILAGAKDNAEQELEISKGLSDEQLSHQTGLNMISLCELIGGADLLISGDTVAIHIAALLGIPAVCIAKGDLYGRFIPYPPELSARIRCIFPVNFITTTENYDQWSPFAIDEVSVEDVFDAVAEILNYEVQNKIEPA